MGHDVEQIVNKSENTGGIRRFGPHFRARHRIDFVETLKGTGSCIDMTVDSPWHTMRIVGNKSGRVNPIFPFGSLW